MTDWTDNYDQKMVAEKASRLIDDLIASVHQKRLPAYNDLSVKELALLIRFPLHVASNVFIERLMRVAKQKKMKIESDYPEAPERTDRFNDTKEAVIRCYYDQSINFNLMSRIAKVLGLKVGCLARAAAGQEKPQAKLLASSASGYGSLRTTIGKLLRNTYIQVKKPAVIGESSNWMLGLLSKWQVLPFDYLPKKQRVDQQQRGELKKCAAELFARSLPGLLPDLNKEVGTSLAELYAEFVVFVLPLSLLEELLERTAHYEKVLQKWPVKQVHSFTGYYYNDNFKVFSILAKRKKALLVSHAHGISNFFPTHKHIDNELSFIDKYITWGKDDGSWLKGGRNMDSCEMVGRGSCYLSGIRKWKKREIDKDKLTVLYPSGPLMDFMTDLEEIAPERNREHRRKVLNLLRHIKQEYPSLKIIYKPFPGTDLNDPIKEQFLNELADGTLIYTDKKPAELYGEVDIVLWDTISTGFAESVCSGAPTLAFLSQYELECSKPAGEKINQELMKCGVTFCDLEGGIESFRRIIVDTPAFFRSGEETLKRFQTLVAYPVDKKIFLRGAKIS